MPEMCYLESDILSLYMQAGITRGICFREKIFGGGEKLHLLDFHKLSEIDQMLHNRHEMKSLCNNYRL